MLSVINRTFPGLPARVYFRHLVFSFLIVAFLWTIMSSTAAPLPTFAYVLLLVNTLLYPFARFIYERAVGFVLGENMFVVPAFFLFFGKAMTMGLCWGLAMFLGPLGMLYLYAQRRLDGAPSRTPI
jgi:hypothetical protein